MPLGKVLGALWGLRIGGGDTCWVDALGELGIGRECLAAGRAWIEARADELPGVQWHVENSGISGGGHVGS